MNHSRTPPYGTRLRAVLAQPSTWPWYIGTSANGQGLTLNVLTGSDAWRLAGQWTEQPRLYVLAPIGDDPARFDWRLLAGHDPVLLHIIGQVDGDHIRRLVPAILGDGTRRVLRMDNGVMYIAEVRHVA